MNQVNLSKISTESAGSKILTFTLTMFLSFICVVYLSVGQDWPDVVVCIMIILINTILSYRLVFNHYSLFYDRSNAVVIVKKGKETIAFEKSLFLEKMKIASYGMTLSFSFKYYKLIVENKQFRIRFSYPNQNLYKVIPDLNSDAFNVGQKIKELIK